MGLTVLYFGVITHFKPYVNYADNLLAINSQAMLFLTLSGALMMKFHVGFENTGVYEEGFGIPTINAVLISSAVGVTFAGLASAIAAIFYACTDAKGDAGEDDVEVKFKQDTAISNGVAKKKMII